MQAAVEAAAQYEQGHAVDVEVPAAPGAAGPGDHQGGDDQDGYPAGEHAPHKGIGRVDPVGSHDHRQIEPYGAEEEPAASSGGGHH